MEDQLSYGQDKKVTFRQYLEQRGINETLLAKTMEVSKPTFIKKKNTPGDFSWNEIVKGAEFLNMTSREFIKKFLE